MEKPEISGDTHDDSFRKRKRLTKIEGNLCCQIKCHCPKILESRYCEYHQQQFYYLDIAERVDVAGEFKSHSVLLKNIKAKETLLLGKELTQEAKKSVEHLYSEKPIGLCEKKGYFKGIRSMSTCNRGVKHKSYKLCPMHLYSFIANRMKKKIATKKILDNFAEDNNLFVKDKYSVEKNDIKPTRCRWKSIEGVACGSRCERFMHTYWCSKHIHTPQAIQCLIKRDIFLSSEVLLKHLREIVVSWV